VGGVAFLFPGQGSQEVGMGRAMAEGVPAAREVYERASAELGFDLAEVCFSGPLERLTATDVAQPALVATSLACLAAAHEGVARADVVAGHSVGEYAALAAAEVIGVEDAVRLVRERGIGMAEAGRREPGTMAAVIGLDDERVEELCAGIDGVWPANYNCPGQLVVSGTPAGVEALCAAAKEAGARRALPLNVAGAFHSPLMAPAEERLRPVLATASFAEPSVPFLSTTTCDIEHVTAIPGTLLRQLTAPVRFTQSVRALLDRGVTTFVELGPGNVLCGLVRRIDRSARCLSVSTPDDLGRLEEVAVA
jgi:[acyl-carrier-protein] S-malonyltransferase